MASTRKLCVLQLVQSECLAVASRKSLPSKLPLSPRHEAAYNHLARKLNLPRNYMSYWPVSVLFGTQALLGSENLKHASLKS
eukprot:5917177-Amphidinium_carterae.1